MNKRLLAIAAAGMLAFASPALAVPTLQLTSDSGAYCESCDQTWMVGDSTFDLTVAGATSPDAVYLLTDVVLYATILGDPTIGTITVDGAAGTQSDGAYSVNSHYPVDEATAHTFIWDIDDLEAGTAGDTIYDYQLYPAGGSDTGDLDVYGIEITGFDLVHFDVTAYAFDANGDPIPTENNPKWYFNPPSHDLQYQSDCERDCEPIPEPGTMLLMGSGLAGLAAWKRRRRDGEDA